MIKKTLSLLLSLCVVWTSGSLLDAALTAPEIFSGSSDLPQFLLQPPGQLGRIADYFNANPKAPLVILIQDLHAHYGVQKNIAGILEFLSQKLSHTSSSLHLFVSSPLFALAVEGASGPIDSSVMALFPDEKIKLAASDYLMREGELTGAEYFAIKHGAPNLLVGIENEQYYTVHRDLFRKTLQDRSELVSTLKSLKSDIDQLLRFVFHKNKALWDFHKTAEAYEKGEMSTHDYIGYLMDRAGAIDLKRDFPALASFAANSRFGTMDEVCAATNGFLTQIQGQLTNQEKADLKLLTKNKGASAYYLYLRELIFKKKLFLAVPSALAQYLEYIHTAQTMGMDRVTHEARELAFRIKLSLAGQGNTRDLVQVQHDLDLLLRLSDLQATEYEVRDFAPRLNQFVALTKALLKDKNQFDETKIRRLISSSIDFYVMALMRNKPMIDNTLALSAPVSVLVAGGFHTVQLTNLLREKNISYLVITPTVEKVTEADHDLYVKRLNGQDLTPEEIFASLDRGHRTDSALANLLGLRGSQEGLAVGLERTRVVPRWIWAAGAVFAAAEVHDANKHHAVEIMNMLAQFKQHFAAYFAQYPAAQKALSEALKQVSPDHALVVGKGAAAGLGTSATGMVGTAAILNPKGIVQAIRRLLTGSLSVFRPTLRKLARPWVLGPIAMTLFPAFAKADSFFRNSAGQLMIHVDKWTPGSSEGTPSGIGWWIQKAMRATGHMTRAQAKWDTSSLAEQFHQHFMVPNADKIPDPAHFNLPPGDYAINGNIEKMSDVQQWLLQHHGKVVENIIPQTPHAPSLTPPPYHVQLPHLPNISWPDQAMGWIYHNATTIEVVIGGIALIAGVWLAKRYLWPKVKAWRQAHQPAPPGVRPRDARRQEALRNRLRRANEAFEAAGAALIKARGRHFDAEAALHDARRELALAASPRDKAEAIQTLEDAIENYKSADAHLSSAQRAYQRRREAYRQAGSPAAAGILPGGTPSPTGPAMPPSTPPSDASGSLRRVRTSQAGIDPTNEALRQQLQMRRPEFEAIARRGSAQPFDFMGRTIPAFVVEADFGDGLEREDGYQFESETQGTYVIVINNRASDEVRKETLFHEQREIGWITQGFGQSEAHILASNEQSGVGTFANHHTGLTQFHTTELNRMSAQELRDLIQEYRSGGRRRHHDLLARVQSPYIDLTKVDAYDRRFIEYALQQLSYHIREAEDRLSDVDRRLRDATLLQAEDELAAARQEFKPSNRVWGFILRQISRVRRPLARPRDRAEGIIALRQERIQRLIEVQEMMRIVNDVRIGIPTSGPVAETGPPAASTLLFDTVLEQMGTQQADEEQADRWLALALAANLYQISPILAALTGLDERQAEREELAALRKTDERAAAERWEARTTELAKYAAGQAVYGALPFFIALLQQEIAEQERIEAIAARAFADQQVQELQQRAQQLALPVPSGRMVEHTQPRFLNANPAAAVAPAPIARTSRQRRTPEVLPPSGQTYLMPATEAERQRQAKEVVGFFPQQPARQLPPPRPQPGSLTSRLADPIPPKALQPTLPMAGEVIAQTVFLAVEDAMPIKLPAPIAPSQSEPVSIEAPPLAATLPMGYPKTTQGLSEPRLLPAGMMDLRPPTIQPGAATTRSSANHVAFPSHPRIPILFEAVSVITQTALLAVEHVLPIKLPAPIAPSQSEPVSIEAPPLAATLPMGYPKTTQGLSEPRLLPAGMMDLRPPTIQPGVVIRRSSDRVPFPLRTPFSSSLEGKITLVNDWEDLQQETQALEWIAEQRNSLRVASFGGKLTTALIAETNGARSAWAADQASLLAANENVNRAHVGLTIALQLYGIQAHINEAKIASLTQNQIDTWQEALTQIQNGMKGHSLENDEELLNIVSEIQVALLREENALPEVEKLRYLQDQAANLPDGRPLAELITAISQWNTNLINLRATIQPVVFPQRAEFDAELAVLHGRILAAAISIATSSLGNWTGSVRATPAAEINQDQIKKWEDQKTAWENWCSSMGIQEDKQVKAAMDQLAIAVAAVTGIAKSFSEAEALIQKLDAFAPKDVTQEWIHWGMSERDRLARAMEGTYQDDPAVAGALNRLDLALHSARAKQVAQYLITNSTLPDFETFMSLLERQDPARFQVPWWNNFAVLFAGVDELTRTDPAEALRFFQEVRPYYHDNVASTFMRDLQRRSMAEVRAFNNLYSTGEIWKHLNQFYSGLTESIAISILKLVHQKFNHFMRPDHPGRAALLKREAALEHARRFVQAIEAGRVENGGYQIDQHVDLTSSKASRIKETVIMTDTHGHTEYIQKALMHRSDGGKTLLEKMEAGEAVFKIAGDAVHPENGDFRNMIPSLLELQLIMHLKICFPRNFYFELGDHEFLDAGTMKGGEPQGWILRDLMLQEYGQEYVDLYRKALQNSPLYGVGDGYADIHAGPIRGVGADQMDNIPIQDVFRNNQDPRLVQATWGRPSDWYEAQPARDNLGFQEMWKDLIFTQADVQAFMQAVGQPNGVLILGHTYLSENPDEWHSIPQSMPTTHIISAARRRGGIAIARNGSVVFQDITDVDNSSFQTPVIKSTGANWLAGILNGWMGLAYAILGASAMETALPLHALEYIRPIVAVHPGIAFAAATAAAIIFFFLHPLLKALFAPQYKGMNKWEAFRHALNAILHPQNDVQRENRLYIFAMTLLTFVGALVVTDPNLAAAVSQYHLIAAFTAAHTMFNAMANRMLPSHLVEQMLPRVQLAATEAAQAGGVPRLDDPALGLTPSDTPDLARERDGLLSPIAIAIKTAA